MNEGANVFEVGVPFLESLRFCRGSPSEGPSEALNEVCDCVLLCEGGVDVPGSGDGEAKRADFGRPVLIGAGEEEGILEKGLLRLCAEPLALKAICLFSHQQLLALWC